MIWEAILKDGNKIREFTDGVETEFDSLNKDNVEMFRITETGHEIAVPFNSDSGIIRFTNLDVREQSKIENGREIRFVYDTNTQQFKMDMDSLKFYNTLVLHDPRTYYFIEFDQTGKFNVAHQQFYMGFELDGEEIAFLNQPPYNDFFHRKNGVTDFLMQKDQPVQKRDATISYTIGYKHVHKHNDIEFDTSYTIVYDVLNKCVTLDFLVSTNITVKGKLFIVLGDKKSYLPIELYAGQRTQTKRNLAVLV